MHATKKLTWFYRGNSPTQSFGVFCCAMSRLEDSYQIGKSVHWIPFINFVNINSTSPAQWSVWILWNSNAVLLVRHYWWNQVSLKLIQEKDQSIWGWMDKWMDGFYMTDGWMDGWMDRHCTWNICNPSPSVKWSSFPLIFMSWENDAISKGSELWWEGTFWSWAFWKSRWRRGKWRDSEWLMMCIWPCSCKCK